MFGLMTFFVYIPLFIGLFVMGMNLIFSIQANTVARDLDNMYIHGTDFSAYGAQQLAQQMATGLGLQFPAFGSGVTNQATNTGTTGNGIVWVTQIMYVGTTSDNLCTSVLPSSCTNANSFVYTQQIIFGNSNLTTQKNTTIGNPTGATLSTAGVVSNPVTDSHAQLGSDVPDGHGRLVADHGERAGQPDRRTSCLHRGDLLPDSAAQPWLLYQQGRVCALFLLGA